MKQRCETIEKNVPISYFSNSAFLNPRCKKARLTININASNLKEYIISEVARLIQNQNSGNKLLY